MRRLALVGVLVYALAGPASAAPCWKSVVLDWSADGSVDRTYKVACYHQAIAHLQPDLELYSSAGEDIRRALQHAVTAGGDPLEQPAAATAGGDGDSVPTPLLVLGGLAVLLVATGAAGMVWHRARGDGTDAT